MSGGNKIKIFVRGTSVGGEKLENVKFFKFGYFQWSGEMEFLFFCSPIGYTLNRFIQLDFVFHTRFFEGILAKYCTNFNEMPRSFGVFQNLSMKMFSGISV